MEELAVQVAGAVLAAAVAALTGACARMLQGLRKRQKAEDMALEAVLRRMIIEAWAEHVEAGEPMSVGRKREIEEMAEAYFGLGGNGTAKRQVDELMEIRPRTEARGRKG